MYQGFKGIHIGFKHKTLGLQSYIERFIVTPLFVDDYVCVSG